MAPEVHQPDRRRSFKALLQYHIYSKLILLKNLYFRICIERSSNRIALVLNLLRLPGFLLDGEWPCMMPLLVIAGWIDGAKR